MSVLEWVLTGALSVTLALLFVAVYQRDEARSLARGYYIELERILLEYGGSKERTR